MKTILCWTLCVLAQSPPDAARQAQIVAPFIDSQTIAVGHLDLTRVQVGPLVAELLDLLSAINLRSRQTSETLQHVQATLLQAGLENLYVIASFADLPAHPPFCIVPTDREVSVDKILKELPQNGPASQNGHIEQLGDVLLCGSRSVLERIKRTQPDARPELASAFEAAGDAPIQLLLLPTADDRRVIEEILPTLPAEIGHGRSTILTHGLLWAALAIEQEPDFRVRLAIQSRDRQSAAAFRDKWATALRLLLERTGTAAEPSLAEKAASVLTPQVNDDGLRLVLDQEGEGLTTLATALQAPPRALNQNLWRDKVTRDLKNIGLALQNWHDRHMSFPAQASYAEDGTPLLSWRVHILPMLDQGKLYRQFHLDEPWDSEHNRKLVGRIPEVYRSPASTPADGLTCYLLPAGKGTICPGRRGVPMKEIKDGTSNTIIVVMVDNEHAVPWTKPQDLDFDPKQPARGLASFFGCFPSALCDGSVLFLDLKTQPEKLRAYFTCAGGEVVP